ncbi:MAG TPA: hypothetical protein P5330_09315 [Candidatus Competibacteraceae bacterium]|nr:hypothetical protein [Candidatus Competibacteraceae bacterium]
MRDRGAQSETRAGPAGGGGISCPVIDGYDRGHLRTGCAVGPARLPRDGIPVISLMRMRSVGSDRGLLVSLP